MESPRPVLRQQGDQLGDGSRRFGADLTKRGDGGLADLFLLVSQLPGSGRGRRLGRSRPAPRRPRHG